MDSGQRPSLGTVHCPRPLEQPLQRFSNRRRNLGGPSALPLHEHVEIEQTWVLEGSIVDAEGETTTGNFSWRPKGNQHRATAPNGALVLCFFLKPNKFLEGPAAGSTLE